jgi:hypothetical protein
MGIITLNHTTLNCRAQGGSKHDDARQYYGNNYRITHAFATSQPTFIITTFGWHVAAFHTYVAWDYRYKKGAASVNSKHIIAFATFFSETIITGLLWVRTKNYEWLMWENYISKHDTSCVIIHCLHGWFFGSRRSERCLWNNDAYGNNG